MSTRGGGGRRGGGDFQNRGGGRGGGGRGRGRGRGGDEQQPVGPRPRRDPPIGHLAPAPVIARGALSSPSVSRSPQMMTGEMEKLTIGGQAAGAERPMEPLAVTATVEGARLAPAPVSSKAITVPRRPGYGTKGVKCIVRANHFLVEVASRDLVHYDVAIVPEVTSRTVCRNIVGQLVASYKESHLGRLTPVYDGRKSLYTAGELPFKSQKFKIELTDRDRLKEYDVTIQLAGRADLHHLQQFLQGRQSDVPQDTIQVLDIVLRESPSRNYVTVGRSFFSPEFGHLKDIGDGLECWRGYYQSLRPTQMGLSLNIDISATSFYKPVSVVDFIAEYFNLQQRDISRPLTEKQRIGIKKALRGIRVEVTHRKDFNRRYRITGISAENLSQLTFVDDSGARKHVMQYFKDKYNCQLKHGNWPCLQSGNDKKPTYLPMEICKIVEGQRFSKKLNEKQVTEILRSTCQRPNQREKSIMEMVRQNAYNKDKHAGEFGIKLVEHLTSVEARVLPPPMLKYHDSGREKTCSPRVGAWNMINKRMVNGGSIQSWACISFSWKLRPEAVYKFCESLFGVCNNIGMAVNPNPVIDVLFENPENVEGALRKAYDQVSVIKGDKQPLQLLLIVLPDVKGSHGKIKRVCETELGIVSQCCLPTHVYQCKPQYMENVALKINVKVGGRNTVLVDAISRQIPLVSDKPTIIFGADVTHPAPGEDSLSSIAAVVASVDWPEVTKYRALVSSQPHREEIIKDLYIPNAKDSTPGGMIRELLLAFYRSARQKPHRIIFYRDGVSEGQFSQVLLYEMDAIRKACQSLEKDYAPPVTFVVVQKRHHTRLFPDERSNMTDRSGNIMPGTVVDTKICHPTEFDFYLCSHAGIQGTSRPTHYHVLFDENNFTADGLQTLTNNLCYTYARCTRSVSLVPPAYYAHLAAFRARDYVEGDSERASSAGGDTRARTTEVRPLPGIKDNVKDVMFYC